MNQKPRSLIITLIISAGALAYGLLVFLPTSKSIAQLRRQLKEQRAFVLEMDEKYKSIAELESKLEAAQQYVQDWRASSPKKARLAGFLGSVSEIAAQSGVALQRINPLEPLQLATIQEHSVDLTVEGGFDQVFRFLHQLESHSATVWTSRLQMENTSEDGQTVRCQINLAVFADDRDGSD